MSESLSRSDGCPFRYAACWRGFPARSPAADEGDWRKAKQRSETFQFAACRRKIVSLVHDLIKASYYAAMKAESRRFTAVRDMLRLLAQSENYGSVARKQGAADTMTKRKSSNTVSPVQFIEKVVSDGIMSITAEEVQSRLTSTELAQRRLKIFLQIFSYFGKSFMSATPMK